MNQLFDAPTSYAADFEEARAAYRPPKNDSKSDAYSAWTKTAKQRMSAGAFGHRMVECCRLYSAWIDEENVKRARQRQNDYPKKHMATWLNKRGWENFLADAETAFTKATVDAAKQKILCEGWEDEAAKLIAELTDARFTAWFDNVQVRRGPPVEVMFPNSFKASYVAKSFSYAMRRAFGECRLTAAGSSEKFDI